MIQTHPRGKDKRTKYKMPKGASGKMKRGMNMTSPTKYASNNGKVVPPKKASEKKA